MASNPYPGLNSNINDPNRASNQLNAYVDPDTYSSNMNRQAGTSSGPAVGGAALGANMNTGYNNNAAGYNNRAGYNQGYNPGYNNTGYRNQAGYNPNYGGGPVYPPGYNDPNHEHYEIYNPGYSNRQRCIIIGAIIFFAFIIGGFILFVSRQMRGQKYPYY